MNALILYASKYGATKAAAEKLAEALGGDAQLQNLEGKGRAPLEAFDTVVVGGPVYAGILRKSVKLFCQQHEQALTEKKLGLFICCAYAGQEARQAMEANYPEGLLQHAAATGLFGGEFQFEKMNFLETKILHMVQKSRGDATLPALDEAAIRTFAQKMSE